MFNKIIKKSSKLIAIVLAIALAFSPLSYAGDVGSFAEFVTAISDGTATIDIINSFTADPGDGPLGTQIASILAINGNNYVVDAANKAGLIIGSGKETTINNLTFKNFSATSGNGGSAIHNSGNLTLTGVKFSTNTYSLGNQNTKGGSAIYNEKDATITITNGEFSFNKNTSTGQSYGGAIYNIGTMSMGDGLRVSSNSTTLTGNTKSNGGAIYNGPDGDLTIGSGSLFQFNEAKQGGAISNDGQMTIGTNAHFYHNESTLDSGAIGVWTGNNKTGTLTILDGALFDFNKSKDAGAIYNKAKSKTEIGKNARFISNTATNTAGAIRNADSSTLTIKDGALFEQNAVTDNTGKGGAIYNEGTGAANKTNVNLLGSVTFKDNTSNGSAGAIYNEKATLQISEGAIFNANTAVDYGGAIVNTTNAKMSIGDPAITDPEITIKFIYNRAHGEGGTTTAGRGGAIDNYENSTIIIGNNVDFSFNMARRAGAAIFNETGSTITIGNNVNFGSNIVTTGGTQYNYGGGAIWNSDNSTITIGNNVTFSSNESNTSGGAIYNAKNSQIDIGENENNNNINFMLNTSGESGGAIYNVNSSIINITGSKISFISNTAGQYGGAIYSEENSFVNIVNNAEFKSNSASIGGAIYNDVNSEITIGDGAKFEDNTNTNTNYESGAIYNTGTINIGTSTFKNNKTGTKNRDIYNTGNLNFTIDSSVTGGTTTMTGGISNERDEDKGITTIKSGVTLMVGYNEDETTASGAIFKQSNVVVEDGAKWYFNVDLTNDFKINDTVTSQAGSEIYINGSGTLEWNTTGEGDFYYNGENIIIKADNLQHGTMNITGNNNVVTRISRTDGETPITTVNAINAPNATFINNGIFNLNLSSSDGYNLKTLTNSETDKGTFNINVKDNITLDLTDKTIQQKETVVSSDNSSSLTIKNAELSSDLVNNLSGEGLILQESEVKGQLKNQGQMVLEDSEVDGQITNSQGTMTILGDFVIQNGIASAGYTAQYNTINIGNASKSATVTSSTTISDQTIVISNGSLIMNNDNVDGEISNSQITVNTNGILTANADKISVPNNSEIVNEGTVNFTGGTNKNDITGAGNLTIDGTVINKTETSITQSAITVNSGKSFTANASDITTTGDGIVNRGSVTFTGTGTTNANKITGDGELTINGSVTNISQVEQSTITITSGNTLTTDAGNIETTNGIVNEGSLVFVDIDGTNKNKISGDGILTINGKVENETGTSIEQNSISIMTNKSFTANADDMTTANGIVNVGTLILTGGTNTNNINPGFSDAGRLEIKGNVENAENIAQKEVEVISGRLTNNEGKTITATTLTNNGEIINSGTITGRTGANNAVSNEGTIINTGRIQATDISNEENAVINNEGTIESVNAIANSGTITSNADNIIINGSNKEIKNSGIYNITGGTANYKITGDSENKGIVNIKDNGVKLNDVISNSTINLSKALNVGNDSYLDATSTLVIEDGAILITDNGSVNEIGATINIANGAQWEYQLDVDLQNESADRLLNIGTVGNESLATISSIHLANDDTAAKTVLIANKDIHANIPENIRIYTTNYKYVVVSSTDTEGRTWLNIQAAGFGGLQGAVYEGASTYNVTGSIDYLTAWIEEGGKLHDTLKANLEIVGYNNVLTSTTGASGIKTSTYTLKVTDLNEYSGFENAITVQKIGNNVGNLIVSTVTFRNNSGSAVIINAGNVELSNVTFSNNSADIDIENNGNLKISKDDVTLDKGIDGIGNTTIEKGATLVNGEGSIIIQSSMTVAGTLTNNNVNENVIVATDKIEVKNDGKIITNASAINTINGIINAGTVIFTGGTNSDVITGENGRLEIAGTVQNDSNVTQKEVEVTGNLINNAGKTISATTVTNKSEAEISNSGIINTTTLTNETGATIGNVGEINAATLTNNAGATITNTGTITGTNNTITNSGNVANSGTIKATTLTNSGTISNSGIIDSENAITNNGTITSDARRIRTEINNSGTYNITAGKVSYKITGTNGTININTDEVTISTSISNNNINLSKKLTLEDENYLENSTLTIQNGAILITDNGEARAVSGTVNIEGNANWDYQLDVNLQGTVADNLTIGSVGEKSTATITSIRLANDKATQTKVEIASTDIHAEISSELKIYSTTLNYKVTSVVENGKTILVLEAIGYGGLADAIYDKASDYSVTEGQDITTSWINGNDTLKKNLKVHGNNSILTSTTSLSGIKTSTYTLTINDLQEYSGFTNAITVNDASGKLEVKNVTFTGNKGTAVIINEGTVELSSVTFKNNSATLDIANNGEIKVKGEKKTVLEKGIKGLGNTTIENGAELESGIGSKISQSNITVAGKLTNKNENANSIIVTENLKIEQLTGELITNAGAIGTISGIENDGRLTFTGGTNKNEITGDGELVIDGEEVINKNGTEISQKKITVNEEKKLKTNASDITTDVNYGIANEGTIDFVAGKNENKISGNGELDITGTVENAADVNQGKADIKDTGKLTNNSGKTITATEVTNSGTVTNAGTVNATTLTNNATITNSGTITGTDNTITNKGEITNSGTISAKTIENETNATITNAAEKTITVTTLTNSGDITNEGTITSVNAIENSGTLASDAGKIVVSGENKEISNSGVVNFTGGENTNKVTGSGELDITGEVTNKAEVTQGKVDISGKLTNGTGNKIKAGELTNNGELTSDAEDIEITGANNEISNTGTYNIRGGEVSYDIKGTEEKRGKVNIKDNEVTIGASVTNNDISLAGTALKISNEANIANTSTLEIGTGSTLDISDNGQIGNVNGVSITAATWNLKLDVELGETTTADTLNIISIVAGSNALIEDINLTRNTNKAEDTVQITNMNINATADIEKEIGGINYKIVARNENNGTWLDIVAYGYGGLAIAVYDSKPTYEVEEETDDTTSWILGNDTLKSNLVIKGNNKKLTTSTGLSGLNTSTYTLTVQDLVEYSGFENAITVGKIGEEKGILNVSSVTFKGNTGEAVIKNAGTTNLSNVTFSENSADIDVANNGTLNITGEGKTTTLEKGINGTGTTTVESGAELVNGNQSTISQTEVTNSGTVTNAGMVNATTLTNNATITNSGTITGTDNTITNEGEITNNGTINATVIENSGEIENTGTITGSANTITNKGEITNIGAINATTLSNKTNATITNEAEKTITATTITNAGTVENAGGVTVTDLTNSGTIENEGIIESVNAIENSGTMTSNAEKIVITGTAKEITNTGTYNVTGGTISYKISGANGTVNIREGEVTLDNIIEDNTINLGTTLKVKDDSYLESTSTLVIENGALLITDNGEASDIAATINIAEGAKWSYQLDVDLQGTKADKLKIAEGGVGAGSEATISSIHLKNDKTTKTTVVIANADINANIPENINIYTTTFKYRVVSRVDESGNTVLDIEEDGFGGLAAAVYEGSPSYSLTEQIDYLTAWIEEPAGVINNFLKANLDIEGNNNVLISTTDAMGIETKEYTLKVSNLEQYTGFTNAITVNDASGKLEVKNVTFTGNKGAAVITNAGTTNLSNVIFSENSAEIDIANSGTLNIIGEGITLEKGINGTGTTTIASGAELVNGSQSTINQKDMEISGILTNNNENTNAISVTNKITVNETGVITSLANAINATNGIVNDGTITFTGGTNANVISGIGELVIDGTVTNTESTTVNQRSITVNSEKNFTANVNDIKTTDKIGNEGTLTYTGEGTNVNVISGTGNLTINGTVTNTEGATINQSSITVNADKKFIVKSATDITTGDGIVNAGTVTFNAGKNMNVISGDNGRLEIAGEVENAANVTQKEVEITNGKLTNDEGKIITSTTVINSGTIENEGTITTKDLTNKENAIIENEGTLTVNETLTNSGTINNESEITATNIANVGTITNEGAITSENAIANSGTITSNADNMKAAISNNNGTYNVTGGTVSYNVTGTNGIINIKENEVTISTGISNNTVSVTKGLKIKKESYIGEGSIVEIGAGAEIDIANGEIGELNGVKITEASWDLNLDVKLEGEGTIDSADKLNIIDTVAAGSSASIKGINFIETGSSKAETSVQIASENINATIASEIVYQTINGINYKISIDETKTDSTWIKIEAYGYGGLAMAVYDSKPTYEVEKETDDTTSWILGNDTLKSNLVIKGNNKKLTTSTGLSGLNTSTYTLTVQDLVEYSGFENAISVGKRGEEKGTLNVSSVTFKGNTGEAVIKNAGTTNLSNVTFSENSADIDVANNGTLNITGEGKTTTLEKGINGTGTTTVESGAELVNGSQSTINQKDITINGTLTNNNGTDNAIITSNKITLKADAVLTSSANAVMAINGIDNAGTIIYTGGKNKSDINGTGNLTIDGNVENKLGTTISQSSITVNEEKKFTTNASDITVTDKIGNAGILVFNGGENKNTIEGTGDLIIDGTVTNKNGTSISQGNVIISAEKSLITSANDVVTSVEIKNSGTLTYIGEGTNKNVITGAGILNVEDALTNEKNISQDTININKGIFTNNDGAKINTGTEINIDEDAGLKSNASDINANSTTAQINNKGVVTFTGGENNNNISGRGNLTIDGEVTNLEGKAINQSSITVNADKKFIVESATDVTTIGDGIVNAGTVTFNGGKNTNVITGDNGRLEIAGEVENDADVTQKEVEVISGKLTNDTNRTINTTTLMNNATITNSGTITGTDNTITNKGEITNSGTINAKTIGNETNATITNETGKTIKTTELTNSGTITNEGTIESVNAIANSGVITSNANNMKAAIANNNGTYNVTGGTVSYNVTGTNGTMNINTGEVTISTTVSGNNVNLTKTLKLEKEEYLDSTSTLEIGDGATLDIQNDNIGAVESEITITGANWNLKLDIDLAAEEGKKVDTLKIAAGGVAAGSQATINGIKILSDKATETFVQIANLDVNAVTNPNPYIYTTNIKYEIVVDDTHSDGTWLKIVASGYGGLANAIYDGALSYSITEGTDYVTAWIEQPEGVTNNFLKEDLIIHGQNNVLTSTTGVVGINVDTHTLTIEDLAEMSGFKNAITVEKVDESSGTANITNVTFKDNTGEAVITNAGTVTLSSVTFSGNTATKDITNNGTLSIEGVGATLENGIDGTGTTTIATTATLVNGSESTISQKDIEISGTLTNNNGSDNAITTTNKITVNENAVVISSANAIKATNGIINKGTMTFTGGKNTNTIDSEFDGYGRIEIAGNVENAAEIYQKDIVVTSGKLTNDAGAIIYVTDYLTNNTEIVNNGIINPSNVTNETNASIENTGEINATNITNKENAIINNKENGKIGTVNLGNKGTINNASDFNASASFESSGTVTNSGTITAGKLTNYENGIINNEENGKIVATVNNKGIINNKSGAEIEATALTNSGAITSSGTITSNTIENNENATINNEEGGEIVVDSALINNGTISNKSSITVRNNITNNENGKITNSENAEINVTDLTNRGIITNEGTIISENAIANSGTITSNANNIKAGINNTGEYNVIGGTISYKITGDSADNGTINVKTDEVTIANDIEKNTINLETTLKVEKESYLKDTSTLAIVGTDSVVDIKNGEIGTVDAEVAITAATWELKLDIDLQGKTADLLNNVIDNDSTVIITALNILTDKANNDKIKIANKNIVNVFDVVYHFSTEKMNYKAVLTGDDNGSYLKLTAEGYGGLANAIYDGDETYDIEAGEEGKDYVTAWIEDPVGVQNNFLKKDLTVNGSVNNSVLTSTTGVSGIDVNTHKLTVKDLTEYSGFENALTVSETGELTISTVTFTGNKGAAVITNAGTTNLSNVIFSENSAEIDIANSGTLNIIGEGITLEKGINGTGTTTIASGAELVNGSQSTINQKDMEISGILTNNNENTNAISVTNKITVNETGVITSLANTINATNGIVNDGTITFTGGTNANVISGIGELVIDGTVTNSANVKQSTVTINSGKSLTSSADTIRATEKVQNSGDLVLTGGSNKNVITGTGKTTIAEEANVTNENGTINQTDIEIDGKLINNNETSQAITATNITVGDDGVFITNANAISATNGIVNAGTVTFNGGKNSNEIKGNDGRLEIAGEVENVANVTQKEVEITNGKLTNDEGKIITSTTVINSGTIENEGTITTKDLTNKENAIIENEGTLTVNETLTNSGTINNESEITATNIANVGTITNEGAITSENAIANSGAITSNANNIKAGMNNTGEYNITGGTVGYEITGNSGIINIKDDEVIISTSVSNNNVNLTGTTLKLTDESYLADTTTLVIGQGATLNTQNEKIGNVVSAITVADGITWNYQLDLNVQTKSADMLTNVTAAEGSQATINDIKFLADSDKAETTIQISESNIYATVNPDIYTTNIKYKVTAENTDDGTFLKLVASGYGGLANAIYDGALSYSITEDTDYVTAWIEQPEGVINNSLKENLIIHGQNNVLTSTTGVVGINVDTHTLTIEDLAEMSGFKNAITVEKVDESSGTANITNVTFKDNTGEAVITNAGTVILSSVTFNGNQTDTDIANNGELIITGEDTETVLDKGITGEGNTTIASGVELINGENSTIEQDGVTINGTLINDNDSLEAITANDIKIDEDGSLVTDASAIRAENGIDSDGLVTFTGGTNRNEITGEGEISIVGDVINSATVQQSTITIAQNASLTANASDIKTENGIVNIGNVIFTEGTNENVITGTGELNITGTVINNASVQQSTVTISEGAKLTTDASDLETEIKITNSGDLVFTGGTNNNVIEGTGDLEITGDVVNNEEGNIKQNTVTIDENASLETNVNNIVATNGIENDGVITYTGEGINKNKISGDGNLTIDGSVENYIGTTINQSSITVTDNAEFTTNANDITTTGDGILNDGILTFTGGVNTSTITMSTDKNDGILKITGDLDNAAEISQFTIRVEEDVTFTTDAGNLKDVEDLNQTIDLGENATLKLTDNEDATLTTNIQGDGLLIKEGEGTVTLSGENEYTGTTTITGGAIEIVAANGISANTLYMDGGKLIINGESEVELGNEIIGTGHNDVSIEVTGADTSLTGEILGNGNLVKTGEGILDLQMESNSYAGDTIINEGGIKGTTSNINGKVIGSGDENSSVEFYDADGDVTLNEFDAEKFIGTFDKTGASTMTVTNSFKAINANITAGTFVINNDASMGGSGKDFIVEKEMRVENALLKGYGNIDLNGSGDLIIGKNASLAPGNSTTTFKVNGNLIFEDNGNYDVEFGQISESDGGHYNDSTTVTKKTTIGEDATITLNNLEGKYYVKETIDLINSGEIESSENVYKEENVEFVDNDATGLRPGYDTRISTRIYVEDNTLKVELQRKASEYGIADFDKSQNEQEAANAIDAVSTGNGGDITLPLDVLEHFYYYKDPETGETNIPALKAALNDIAGVIHANSTMLTFTNAKIEHVYDKLKDRRECQQHTCVNDRIWAEYYYNTYQVNENENSPKFETNVNGFLVGFDIISSNHWELGEQSSNEYSINGKEKATKGYKVDGKVTTSKWNLGLMGGYGTSELKQRKDKTTMKDINFGLYSGYENENWLLKGMLLGGYEQYTIDRTIGFMNRIASSDHSGYSAALDLEAGYKIGLTGNQARHQMYLKPFVGITGSYINNESYKETGAESLNLKIENYESFNAQARLGIGINGRIKRLGWYAKVGIRRLLMDDYSAIEASLLDYQDQTKMRIRSAELDKFSYGGGLGADFVLSDDWTIFANGLASFADKSTNYYGNVGLIYKFGCSNNDKKIDNSELNKRLTEEALRRELKAKEKELQDREKALKAKEKELQAEKEKEEQELREKEKELQEKIRNYEAKIVSEQQAQKMKEKTIKSIRMEGKPTFKFGTSELNKNGKESLKKVAKELEKYPDADLLIEGHTDSVGSEDVNQRISEERAAAMAKSLKKDYRVPNDISVIGKGEKEPIASNATKEGRAKNRRVEIILTTAE